MMYTESDLFWFLFLSFFSICWNPEFDTLGQMFSTVSLNISYLGRCVCFSVGIRFMMRTLLCSMAQRKRWRSWGRRWKRGGPKPKLRWVLILTEIQVNIRWWKYKVGCLELYFQSNTKLNIKCRSRQGFCLCLFCNQHISTSLFRNQRRAKLLSKVCPHHQNQKVCLMPG